MAQGKEVNFAVGTNGSRDTAKTPCGVLMVNGKIISGAGGSEGLNDVLTINPNSNQSIRLGKVHPGHLIPYSNIQLIVNTRDSSGAIELGDSSFHSQMELTTSGGPVISLTNDINDNGSIGVIGLSGSCAISDSDVFINGVSTLYRGLVSGLLTQGRLNTYQLNTVNTNNSTYFQADTFGNCFVSTNYGDTAIGFSAPLGSAPNISVQTQNGVDSIFFIESNNVNKIYYQDKGVRDTIAGLSDIRNVPTLQFVTNNGATTTKNVTISGSTGNALTVNSSGGNSITANSQISSVDGSGNTAFLEDGIVSSGSTVYNHEIGFRNSTIHPELFMLDGSTGNYYHILFPSSLGGLDRYIYMPLRNFLDTVALQSDIKNYPINISDTVLTGLTTTGVTTVQTFTTTTTCNYNVSGHLTVTALVGGNVNIVLGWTDENSVLQNIRIVSSSTASSIPITYNYNITAKSGTAISSTTFLSGVTSTTYSLSETVFKTHK